MGLFDGGIFGGGGGIFSDGGMTTSRPTLLPDLFLKPTSNLTGGEVVVIGGIVAAVVAVAKWLFDDKVEEAKTEGVKEGYKKASREYEAKLRKQAKEFLEQLEALKKDIESLKNQRDEAMKLVKEASQLVGELEGCINGLKENGITPEDETTKYYEHLSSFIEQLKDAKAA